MDGARPFIELVALVGARELDRLLNRVPAHSPQPW